MGAVVVDGSGALALAVDGIMSIIAPQTALAPAGPIGERPRVGTAIVGKDKLGANYYELVNEGVLELTW